MHSGGYPYDKFHSSESLIISNLKPSEKASIGRDRDRERERERDGEKEREREREREVEKMKRRRKRSWARRGGGEVEESSETTLALLHKHKLTNNTAGAGASVLCPSICLETGVLLVLCPAKLTIEVDSRPLPPLHNQNSPCPMICRVPLAP